MWWDTQQVAGKKGLTGKETHPKKSCRESKGPFYSYDKEKNLRLRITNTHTHTKIKNKKTNKQINKRKTQDTMCKYFRHNTKFIVE